MRKHPFKLHLNLFFILVVLIPSIILTLIAIRAIHREEAYIEKSLESTLLAEVTHVISRIETEIQSLQQELIRSLPEIREKAQSDSIRVWQNRSPLVSLPFLFSPSNTMIYPKQKAMLSEEAASFHDWSEKFVSDQVRIPVYQNIAVAYKDEIVTQGMNFVSAEGEKGDTKKSAEGTADILGEVRSSSSAPSGSAREPEIEPYQEAVKTQKAISQFEQSAPIRERVYQQAKERGQQILSRNVTPGSIGKEEEVIEEPESMFISELRTFGEIAAKNKTGLLPCFIDGQLKLMFWKKDESGHTLGCVIDNNIIKERLLAVLPGIYSPVRILTVLNDQGQPLMTPNGETSQDWKRPFVAREISAKLPHWEVAAYLSDPEMITSKARLASYFLWTLVFILFTSIVVGSTVIFKVFRNELTLARQKTTFVANVSHELKTPLTSIRMFSEMMLNKPEKNIQKQKKYLNVMVSESERLTRLINNILDFSKMEQNKKQYDMQRIDIVQLCKDLLERQRLGLEHKGFELQFKKQLKSIFVRGDEEALKQVLLNILSNAEKYANGNKSIELEVNQKDTFVVIQVKDRGIGIPAYAAKHIFNAFYRIDDQLTSKVRGTGLGLTISKKIVEDHGGTIQYLPRQGGGSIFEIRIPLEA